MPAPYQVWLRQPCLDYLATLRANSRQRLISWLEALANEPSREGDFTSQGNDDRDWQVAILGPHAVVWWVDHAVSEVKRVAEHLKSCRFLITNRSIRRANSIPATENESVQVLVSPARLNSDRLFVRIAARSL